MNYACSAGDPSSIPGLGRSPGEGNGNPLQYPCLENLMDRRAWWAVVCGLGAKRVRHNLATKQQQQQQQQTLLNQRRGLFSKLVFLPDVLLGREFPFEEFYDR